MTFDGTLFLCNMLLIWLTPASFDKSSVPSILEKFCSCFYFFLRNSAFTAVSSFCGWHLVETENIRHYHLTCGSLPSRHVRYVQTRHSSLGEFHFVPQMHLYGD